jgi:hypothetical protein
MFAVESYAAVRRFVFVDGNWRLSAFQQGSSERTP